MSVNAPLLAFPDQDVILDPQTSSGLLPVRMKAVHEPAFTKTRVDADLESGCSGKRVDGVLSNNSIGSQVLATISQIIREGSCPNAKVQNRSQQATSTTIEFWDRTTYSPSMASPYPTKGSALHG